MAAESLSSYPERFQSLKRVFLFGAGEASGEGVPAEIESVWSHRGRLVLKFRGVDSISDAERLRGVEVCIPASERLELPAGEYYVSDLTGCEVIERHTGARVGRVGGLWECGGPGLLKVEPEGGGEELLIPFAKSICVEIDVEGRRIVVDLPQGLKDVNRP